MADNGAQRGRALLDLSNSARPLRISQRADALRRRRAAVGEIARRHCEFVRVFKIAAYPTAST
jgi:hypothetical protein